MSLLPTGSDSTEATAGWHPGGEICDYEREGYMRGREAQDALNTQYATMPMP